jgi:hypothetical protein
VEVLLVMPDRTERMGAVVVSEGVDEGLLRAEAAAFLSLEEHCADCWACREAEAQGLLLEHGRLCREGGELADAWDAAEARIAAAVLVGAAT